MLRVADDELLASHIKAWNTFWSDLQIELEGDDELVKIFFFCCIRHAVCDLFISFLVSRDHCEHFLLNIEFAFAGFQLTATSFLRPESNGTGSRRKRLGRLRRPQLLGHRDVHASAGRAHQSDVGKGTSPLPLHDAERGERLCKCQRLSRFEVIDRESNEIVIVKSEINQI